MQAAAKAHNYGTALELSRQLAARYPRSLRAQMVHGLYALGLKQIPEARSSFKRSPALRADYVPPYVGMGVLELSQQHFGPALQQFQQITQVAPKLDVGWIGCSVCAERLGRKGDCVEYARRATQVAPSSRNAWSNLARQESLYGSKQAAGVALQRANQLAAPSRKP